MAKTTEMVEVALEMLVPYERNAKKHPQEQIDKLKKSIQEFGFISPCLIDRDNRIIAGHGRVEAARQIGMNVVPCVYVEGLTDEQRRAYILADNRLTELGGWDESVMWDELVQLDAEGFDIELTGFDLPEQKADWFENRERFNMSREEGNDEYNEFLDKFEQPKTTDDCYTPDNIYDAVAAYVEEKYNKDRANFVRPFYPGGDYQNEKYKPSDIVVDNPPFSILAQIIDYYLEREQGFFIFTPALSALNYLTRPGVTAISAYAPITYENGATVPTSFVTNLGPEGVAAIAAPDLYKSIEEANDINESMMRKSLPKYDFPVEVLTAAKMGYIAKYGQHLEIKRAESTPIRSLDAMKEAGKGIYGGALLLSERAAAERAAAERAAAERAAATSWPLSEREKEIIKSLGEEVK